MRKYLSHGILYLLVALLLFTGIQGISGFIKEKDLLGVVNVNDSCSFTTDSLFDGTFQQSASVYLNKHLGFHNTLTRINNQITFSVFGISPADNVLVGKDHNLFQMPYINSYLGKDFTGRASITGKIHRLLEFQKIMENHNAHFILVFCPSKVRFMPENLPGKIDTKGNSTNYDTYVDILTHDAKELHFIDFNKYYISLKNNTKYTLFPKPGIHWSNFSSRYFALDSLLKYMEHLSGCKYPSLKLDSLFWSDSLRNPDNDLAEMMNLILPYPSGKVSYAPFSVNTDQAVKPDVLTIGDSFYWQLFGFDKIDQIFNVSDFWAWNEIRYPKHKYDAIKKDDYMFLKQDILNHQFVILMVTETNLPTLLNFDEKIFALFDPSNPVVRELQQKRLERIEFFKKLIMDDPKWTAVVRQKAIDRKITFKEMLQNDAEYMVEYEINNLKNK